MTQIYLLSAFVPSSAVTCLHVLLPFCTCFSLQGGSGLPPSASVSDGLFSKPSFASLTETPEEISLVCHVDDLFRFPPDVVKSSEQSWKALHITLGALGYSTELP